MLKLKQPDPDEVLEKANDLNAPLMPANDDTGPPGQYCGHSGFKL